MRKFQFGLQRVLDVREMREKALLAELAAIRAEYERERELLIEMMQSVDECRNILREKLSGNCPDEIRETYEFMNGLAARCVEQETVIEKVAERRDAKMAEVIEASKERKALEQLKEQKRIEHAREVERQDQIFMDDIAGVRFRRGTESADR